MSTVLAETKDGVCVMTLNRPEKMNAFNRELGLAMCEAFKAADADPSVRVIVLTGAGRAFCAGADIVGGFKGAGLAEKLPKVDGHARDLGGMVTLVMWECDTPIIAAINGVAAGVGLTMTFPADIRIAAKGVKMTIPFSRRGIVFDAASSYFLPRLIGLSKAAELALTGRVFLSDEAKDIGLIHELADKEDVFERAMEIARDIAQNVSPRSAVLIKRLLRDSVCGANAKYDNGGPFDAHMRESIMLTESFETHDCQEGVASFFEKRPPQFQDYDPFE